MRLLTKLGFAACIACMVFFNPLDVLHSQTVHKHLPRASNEAIGKTIQDLEAQLRIAYLKSDSGWLDQHLSDAYIEIDEDGTVKSRTDLVQAFRTADLAYDVVNLSEGSARIFNGDAVLLVQKEDLQGGLRGHNFSGLFRCTHVWIKMNGQWQLASSQLTRVAK